MSSISLGMWILGPNPFYCSSVGTTEEMQQRDLSAARLHSLMPGYVMQSAPSAPTFALFGIRRHPELKDTWTLTAAKALHFIGCDLEYAFQVTNGSLKTAWNADLSMRFADISRFLWVD